MLSDLALLAYLVSLSVSKHVRHRLRIDDRGEGVISTAIAVLIVAFLGASMYVIFTQILTSSGSKASQQVNDIGGAP